MLFYYYMCLIRNERRFVNSILGRSQLGRIGNAYLCANPVSVLKEARNITGPLQDASLKRLLTPYDRFQVTVGSTLVAKGTSPAPA